jgi:hypothetical protein
MQWQQLPVALLRLIWHRLPVIDQFKLLRTCRLFLKAGIDCLSDYESLLVIGGCSDWRWQIDNRIARLFLRTRTHHMCLSLTLSQSMLTNHLQYILIRLPSLRYVRNYCVTDSAIQHANQLFTFSVQLQRPLRHMEVDCNDHVLFLPLGQLLGAHGSSLHTLQLINCQLSDAQLASLLARCRVLHTLSVHNAHRLHGNAFHRAPITLGCLHLLACDRLRSSDLNEAFERLTARGARLHTIRFGGYQSEGQKRTVHDLLRMHLQPPGVVMMASVCTSLTAIAGQLRCVILENVHSPADGQMQTLLNSCPRMIRFKLDNCLLLTDAAFSAIHVRWPLLVDLRLYASYRLSNVMLQALQSCKRLQVVKLKAFERITDDQVWPLLRHLLIDNRLQRLHLIYTQPIDAVQTRFDAWLHDTSIRTGHRWIGHNCRKHRLLQSQSQRDLSLECA